MKVTCISSGNDLTLSVPHQAQEWQELRAKADHSAGRLFRTAWIDHSDTTIMCGESQSIATWGKRTAMHPTCRIIQEFSAYSVERQSFSPDTALGSSIDTLDEA